MAITAQSVIKTVQEQLQDVAGIRWTAIELVKALNDAQRLLVNFRPDLASIQVSHSLTAGAKQAVPANCAQLLEIVRNTSGLSIRMVERRLLEAMEPNWFSKAGSLTIKNASTEKSEPYSFYVYPPAALGASVELVYAKIPTDVPEPSGSSYATVVGNIDVDDSLDVALIHYCMYWALSKDAEFGGNAAMSAMHFKLYQAGAGVNVPQTPTA